MKLKNSSSISEILFYSLIEWLGQPIGNFNLVMGIGY